MAKCRLLYQENEELGRMINSGRLAKLEGDLALQKSFSEEVKKSQSGKYYFDLSVFVINLYLAHSDVSTISSEINFSSNKIYIISSPVYRFVTVLICTFLFVAL